ncbi:MAG TPA: ABC transporter permease [Terriglobales bacterium]|nr:ABC transporter permease [Terriglobales bacterium]
MGLWIMAGVTFREAARKKVLWMALAAGLAFLALFTTGLHYQIRDLAARRMNPILLKQVPGAMLMVGLYAIDLLTVVMTVLVAVDTLSGEISSGTIQAIATKPLPRYQIVLGKWLGFIVMMTAYLGLLVGGINAITYVMAHVTARNVGQGFALMWLESVLLLSVTLFFGTHYSTLTNGVLALGLVGLAFLGGWIEQIGAVTNTPSAVNVGIVASLIMPSEALWRRAANDMQSPLANVINFSPFSSVSLPSSAMVMYAGLYTALALVFAIRRFSKRDL